MIAKDQPTIFGKDVIAAVSSVQDGNMRFNRGDDEQTLKNRLAFLKEVGINPEKATLVQIVYENAEHFARYRIATETHQGLGMFEPVSDLVADALVTTEPGHALFLPLADCTGVVIYDQTKKLLMLSHVGRHSAEINGAKKSVEYLKEQFDTDPADLKVWLSPAVGRATYPLRAMEGKGLHEVILEQLHVAGVPANQIEAADVDTAADENYFSHSRFRKTEEGMDGRFAVVAMMTERGEPAIRS